MWSRLDAYRSWTVRHPILWDLAFSIALGIVIEVAILWFQPPLAIVRRVGDEIADRMIRLSEATTSSLDRSAAFAFVDIDNATWKSWGTPLITPRDKLAGLIERVASYRPSAIIVDVDLSFPVDASAAAGEDRLRAVLAGYPADAPPLLLGRNVVSNTGAADSLYPSLRSTPYDGVTRDQKNIVWAIPRFEEDSDGNVRRWRLFEVACEDGQPVIVPSTYLVAAAIARGTIAGPIAGDDSPNALPALLAPLLPANCQERPSNPQPVTVGAGDPPIRVAAASAHALNNGAVRVAEDAASRRIIYRVRWRDDAIELGPIVRPPTIGPTPLIAVRPASTVLDMPIATAATASAGPGFANRIVIISGSYVDSGDWHRTPIGPMPGALLIVNAIEALVLGGTPREPGTALGVAISLGLILGVSLLVSVFRPVVAAWLSSLLILLIMLISLPSFKSGVVLDLAVPSVGIFLHDILASITASLHDFRRHRWRWFLRTHEAAAVPGTKKRTRR